MHFGPRLDDHGEDGLTVMATSTEVTNDRGPEPHQTGSSDVSVGRMTRTEVGWDRPREVLRDSTHGMNARGLSVNERSDVLASVFSRRLGVPGCTSGAEQLRAGGQGGPPLAVPCPARQPAGRRHLMRGDREPVREGQLACEVAL